MTIYILYKYPNTTATITGGHTEDIFDDFVSYGSSSPTAWSPMSCCVRMPVQGRVFTCTGRVFKPGGVVKEGKKKAGDVPAQVNAPRLSALSTPLGARSCALASGSGVSREKKERKWGLTCTFRLRWQHRVNNI